jgi:hypothetical protein
LSIFSYRAPVLDKRSWEGIPLQIAAPVIEIVMVASLRYSDTFVKIDGSWFFAERLLYVDWLEGRPLS